MNAPSATELRHVSQASGVHTPAAPGDYVVHWRSSFGVILIAVRAGNVYVNGEQVHPADGARGLNDSPHLERIEEMPYGA
jgi:hypothetical protein